MSDLPPSGMHSLPEMLETLRANPDIATMCGFPPLNLEMHLHCVGGDIFEMVIRNPVTAEVVTEESGLTPGDVAFRVGVLQRCQCMAIHGLAANSNLAEEAEAFLAEQSG